ncbi:MAG: GSCFA domain-containing protein [Mediterranea sp.]|nr:GSCFA domain-containing protein [Mediterranea sp.]
MNLITPVEHPATLPAITHAHELLLMGSCFAESIGTLLTANKFRCDVNPFGILYNPCSIAAALREMLAGKVYTAEDLLHDCGEYHSLMHHSSFSSSEVSTCLTNINNRLQHIHRKINHIDYLLITFGTAWVYSFKATGTIVANCHKLSGSMFERRRLKPDEIVTEYMPLIDELLTRNPELHILFTVSPIRHTKEGMHGNRLSKAILLLAIDHLQERFSNKVHYFPAYEIMMDELRDYRFYADDMVHPSSLAVQYIWERFAQTCFSSEAKKLIKEWEDIAKALAHRSSREESEEYKRFLEQIVLKIKQLTEKYPNLEVNKELTICHTRLKR